MSKDTVRLHFGQLPSEDLLEIWAANDRDEYAGDTFKVISEILTEREIDIPPQGVLGAENTKKQKRVNAPKQKAFNILAFMAIIIIVFVAFSGHGSSTSSTPSPTATASTPVSPSSTTLVNIGEKGHLVENGDSNVIVAASSTAFDKNLNASVAHDTIGTQQLLSTGELFMVKANTQVLMLGHEGLGVAHVRILEGDYHGKEGWIPSEWAIK